MLYSVTTNILWMGMLKKSLKIPKG